MKIAPHVDLTDAERSVLQRWSRGRSTPARLVLRAKIALLAAGGKTNKTIAAELGTSKPTVGRWRSRFVSKRLLGIEKDAPRGGRKRLFVRPDDKQAIDAVFQLLHSPPIAHGINRTSWRVRDLSRVLNSEGTPMDLGTLAKIIKAAGFRWRQAKVVLTSNDPEYHAKLDRIHAILSNLQPDERFFSIDEYGPFAIKKRGGRRLVPEGEVTKIPQYQTSKGTLLVTAAIELSRNQVTHIYSKAKNTTELLRLLKRLRKQYTRCRTLYFSWDSASWHKSKDVLEWVDTVNGGKDSQAGPLVELAPLPSNSQFLNVIESVFSGLAKAVIHNSDYQSPKEARTAIDRHFRERNRYFRQNPKRAGNKIWGKELVPAVFSAGQNCKDPAWR